MATHWGRYLERIDALFEEALRLCVLRALKTMHKLLSGNQVGKFAFWTNFGQPPKVIIELQHFHYFSGF